jgi:hypothetical protein
MSKPTQEQIDAVFAELDIAFPLRNEITIAKALVEARVTLAAAAKRADAAEALRDVWELRARKVVQERRTLRVERDALRKDAARYRWLRSRDVGPSGIWELYAGEAYPLHMTLKCEIALDEAIDAAMAVQPTTGGAK